MANQKEEELDQLLEKGWAKFEAGDLEAAKKAGDEVLRLEPESPEGHVLLGAVAASSGDVEAALTHHEKAMELDPEFVDPLLYAAELRLTREEFEEAIDLCDQALELAEEEDEYLDALLLKAEALVELGDEEEAKATLAELPPPPTDYPDPQFHVRAARLRLEVDDFDGAETELGRALAQQPGMPDALHALGLVHEMRGDEKKMVEAFRKVRDADLAAPAPPWALSKERFEAVAEAALAELPEKIRNLLANVPIIVADYPAIELVAEGSDPRMMGFYSGVPYPEKSSIGGPPPHLDCVFLYQRNIERYAQSVPEVEEEIRTTLLHETGHFFGLDEDDLEDMGLG